MDMVLKRDLPVRLDEIGPEYGLVELVYPSFARAFGFQLSTLSAADAVEGLDALLEAARGIKMDVEVEGGKGGGEWFGGTRTWAIGDQSCVLTEDKLVTVGNANGNGNGTAEKKEQQWHVQNFWIAYDACDE
jgi:cell division control protein 45